MNNKSLISATVLGVTLGLGITLAGFFIGNALYKFRASQRYVTVKGLAERNVDADLAIWPLTISETGNDLSQVQDGLDAAGNAIHKFLAEFGFNLNDISESPPRITDYYAQGYTGTNIPPYRYKAEKTVTLQSTNVSLVKKAMGQSGKLVKQGIVLANNYGRGTEFLFTGLNTIKPEMIAQATKNAREAAEQFAQDSGSRVGAIRMATQGLFTIRDRDMNSPDLKIVRVVTTVEYFLTGAEDVQ
jgi:hypothetical protein